MRLAVTIAVTFAAALAALAADPAGACAQAPRDPCMHDPEVAVVEGSGWIDKDYDGIWDRDVEGSVTPIVYADYNGNGRRDAGEPQVEGKRGAYELPLDTRDLHGETHVEIRFGVVRYGDNREFGYECLGDAKGCVRRVEVERGRRTSGVDFPVATVAQLAGFIWDDKDDDGRRDEGEEGVEGLNVFLDDDRDGVRDRGEPASHRSFADGRYNFPIPTRYQTAGGQLPPLVLERRAGVDCSAPDDCARTGLQTRSWETITADHGVSRPVVIFVHGYGGSKIECPGKLMWFNPVGGPDLFDMRLGRDGRGLRVSEGGTVCSQNSGPTGLVTDVAGEDIYGGASAHFDAIAWPGRHYDYVWDWRNSPEQAVAGLDSLVEKARCGGEVGCDAKQVRRVQLVGHSMGGLVIRHYIEDAARADKVQRVVTVGTPYWGSPKTIFPVAAGIEVPYFSPMDIFLDDDGMKAASRSFPGHFALMPGFGYGPWLSVSGMNGGRPLDVDGVEEYLRRIGANPMLYTRGVSEHGRVLDHYEDHGVDYHVIAGGGEPTMGGVLLSHGTIEDRATVSWTSGDQTVPAFSAAHDTPSDRLHWVCGLGHVPMTADPQTTRLMDEFLIRGEPIRDERDGCDWSARELSVYYPDLADLRAAAADDPRVLSGGRSLSLAAAERAGLVQVIELGSSATIVAERGADVRVQLPAGSTARVRDIGDKGPGPQRRFGPVKAGTEVALGGSGAVTRRGKAVKPAKADRKPPRTRARVKRLKGGKARLTLEARDASKVAATYVTVRGKRRVYRKPLVVTAKRLRRVRYGSVDVWGNAEKARGAPRPKQRARARR